MVRTARGLSPRAGVLMLAALACMALALAAPDRGLQLTAVAAGLTFSALAILIRGMAATAGISERLAEARLSVLVGHDASPCFTTDDLGQIGWQNAAARSRFRADDGQTLVAALGDHFASPASVLFRLQSRAANLGAGREDVVTRRGHMRLSVHRIAARRFLWRVEEFTDRGATGRGAEGLSLPMLVANKQGVVLFTNEAMRRLVGTRPKRLDRVFVNPVPRSGEEVQVSGAEGPVRAFMAEIEGPGERREIYLLPAPDLPGEDGILADFEHVPVALLKLRADGALRAANRAARELVGPEFQGALSFQDLFDGLGRSIPDWLGDVATERLPGGSEVLRLRRDGGETFVQVTVRRFVEHGRASILAVLHDATAMKTLEAQFVQSQKMQAIGQLAGGIAHDFNNLLTAISGHCDLLLLRRDTADPDFADLVQILQNANRAAGLVGQLLAFSRKQTLNPERVEVQEVLSELGHLLNRLVGERVRIRVSHAPDLPAIRADKRQLEQVLMNLVVNARDAMPEGGTIRIETEARHLAEDRQRDRAPVPAGDYSVISVTDTGVGIPPEWLDKIFEPFFTTKRVGEGTGLGLSTVYGIVKQSGGYVFVQSEPGQGTTFEIWFPVYRPEPETTLPPTRLAAPPPAAAEEAPDGEPAAAAAEEETPLDLILRQLRAEAVHDHAAARAEAERDAQPLHHPRAEEAGDPAGDGSPAAVENVFAPDAAEEGISAEMPAGLPEDAAVPVDVALAGELPPAAPEPVSDPPPGAAAAAADPGPPPAREGRRRLSWLGDPLPAPARQGEGVVLLVEDEAPVRAFASRALRMRGYTVIEAESAEEALEALRDPDLEVDVFVTDVIMPGMDGPSWVRQALVDRPGVRVVFVSGYAEESLATSRDRIPNAVFLPKPFSLNDLALTVKKQILH